MSTHRFPLVPYVPVVHPARCRVRPVDTDAGVRTEEDRSLTSWIRGGRGVRGAALGAAPKDEESAPLLDQERRTDGLLKTANRQANATIFAVMVALAFAVSVFAGLGVVVWRVNDNMHQMELLLRPHADEITDATVEMMKDMGGSFTNLKQITKTTREIAQMPSQPIVEALNNTAAITDKLKEFLKHPTIKLSLGDGT